MARDRGAKEGDEILRRFLTSSLKTGIRVFFEILLGVLGCIDFIMSF